MNVRKTVIAIALLFTISGMVLMSSPSASAGAGITVTNSVGTDVTFSGPAKKAASFGLSFTTTLIGLGCLDDIVMVDTYSAASRSGLTELNGIPDYQVSTDYDMIAQNLAAGAGGFDRNRDVVFVYGYSYHAAAIRAMEVYGLKVVTFYPTSYDMGMRMVETMGAVMGLSEKAKEIVSEMDTAAKYYLEMLHLHGISSSDSRVRGVYVSVSGGDLRVGNVNSYSVMLMKIAGGVNPADDRTKTGSALTSYDPGLSFFVQTGYDVIFLDPYYPGSPEEFRNRYSIDKKVNIYKLDVVMNQYGPTSAKGIEFMAQAMYPDKFGGLEKQNENIDDDRLIYAAAVSAVVSVVSVGYVVFRP